MLKNILKVSLLSVVLITSGCTLKNGAVDNDNNENGALETYNHAMFKFNTGVEKVIIRPVAKGYRLVTNEYIRGKIGNFFNNINEPVYAVNHVLQGSFSNVGTNLSRFAINTTIGGLGFFDVASKFGLNNQKTGFDETLSVWGVPDGPYIVAPILGASTPRSLAGFGVDGFSSPAYWVAHESNGEDASLVYTGVMGVKYLNMYAQNLKLIEGLEEGAVDYYETVKSAYLQNRNKMKNETAENADSYDFDMDDDE